LYERASTRGVAIADCALGNQYLRGLGVVKNQAKAALLCRHSADRGVAVAQADLGQMYLLGEGLERDLPEAAHWFQKAVEQGQANAALMLGKMFWNGDGVERSHEQAARMWQISAEHGNPSAPALLAKYYFAAAIIPADKRPLAEPGSKAAYWGIVATRVDPDSAVRTASQKIVDILLSAAPDLKPKVEGMLATPTPPSF
jgi:TPR repeat protein